MLTVQKRIFLISIIIFIQTFCKTQIEEFDDSLLTVLLMVKNEETVMFDTLKPFLEAGIQSYLILDTGSSDNTVATTRQIFEQYHVKNGYVVEQLFVDFATSRNYAIKQAEEKFPDAKFFLMIDAEWYVDNVVNLIAFCKTMIDTEFNSFLLTGVAGSNNFGTQRLFRAHKGVYFEGAVHEAINQVSRIKIPDVKFYYNPRNIGIEKTRDRWFRDVSLLLKELSLKPNNPRTLFYLAQTYDCLGLLEEAAYWYKKRAEIVGWDEENFMTYYRLAQVYDKQGDSEKAVSCYLKSYSMRPTRAEPLIHLAEHYRHHNQLATSFIFAMRACMIPYPEKDVLFVEKWLYDYTRYDLLGISAWYVGEFVLGLDAVRKALMLNPEATHLQNNLKLYLEKVDEQSL